ncbi:MAG TPA: Na-translocating system protein MpsC family protein [Solirubrobacteraceae bacterium]|nr:Na-translocating system protein MpsC family protein [Solirubrobacteraceae bacterium]
MPSTHTDHTPLGSKAAAISNHVVRTMSEYTGRGPTKGRTHINDDVVTVVLRDTLTKGERSLVGDDLDELVLSMRKAFQGTMRHDLISGIEAILGRKVIAFMSDNHIDPDVAVEIFLLAPGGSATATRGDGARGVAKTPAEAMATEA